MEYDREKLNKRIELGIKTDEEIVEEYNIKEQALKERMIKSGEQFDQTYKRYIVDQKNKELKLQIQRAEQ